MPSAYNNIMLMGSWLGQGDKIFITAVFSSTMKTKFQEQLKGNESETWNDTHLTYFFETLIHVTYLRIGTINKGSIKH